MKSLDEQRLFAIKESVSVCKANKSSMLCVFDICTLILFYVRLKSLNFLNQIFGYYLSQLSLPLINPYLYLVLHHLLTTMYNYNLLFQYYRAGTFLQTPPKSKITYERTGEVTIYFFFLPPILE